ncbi:MAG: hypothetical protein MI748_09500 [Opitutales bacterium]|nr:hypothetical protein [Opitutales bacterium]
MDVLRKILDRFKGRVTISKEILLDQAQFYKDCKKYRDENKNVSLNGKKVIVSGLHNWISNAKIEALIAAYLKKDGFDVSILLRDSDSARRIRRYYEATGNFEYIYLSDFESNLENTEVLESILGLGEKIDQEKLLSLTHLGVKIGKHALSILVRNSHVSLIDFSSEKFQAQLRIVLKNSIIASSAIGRVLEEGHFQMCIASERGYTPNGELFDHCLNRRIEFIQHIGAHKNELSHFKRFSSENESVHPVSINKQKWAELVAQGFSGEDVDDFISEHYDLYANNDWFARKAIQKGKRIVPFDDILKRLNLDLQKKTAVIFAHVLWDATFFYGTDLFENYSDWLVNVVSAACENDSLNWIVKLHPANVWRLKLDGYGGESVDEKLIYEQVGILPDHVKLIGADTDINTASFFGKIDYCLTVRGTVAIEFPMCGIPAITGGTGRCSGLGFTVDSASKEEFFERIRTITDLEPLTREKQELAKQFAYSLYKKRPLEWITFTLRYPDHVHPDNLLYPIFDLNTDIEPYSQDSVDFNRLMEWIGNSEDEDFFGNS